MMDDTSWLLVTEFFQSFRWPFAVGWFWGGLAVWMYFVWQGLIRDEDEWRRWKQNQKRFY